MSRPTIAVFDFGGVLIEWNPRHLYRKLFGGDTAAMEHFLAHVCNSAWNERQDAGRSFAEGIALLKAEHPDMSAMIDAYIERWDEMVPHAIAGTVAVLDELRKRGVPLYAITNWSAETFPRVRHRFDFLAWFKGIVISGQEKVAKPDPRIFAILQQRYHIPRGQAVFIDDAPRNVAGASANGLIGIQFTDPEKLRRDLAGYGLL